MRSIMRSIYDSPGDLGLPLGIVMRFVPNIADPRFKGNDRMRENCRRLHIKQKNFLERTDVQSSPALQCIDFALKEHGTLRSIVMGLESNKSTDEKPANLFISLEEPLESNEVFFIYQKENADQARSTISALPLILEAHYGPRCGCWLTRHSAAYTANREYDKAKGMIKSKDAEYTAGIRQGWQGDSDAEDIFSNDVPVVLGRATQSNQFDDNGTVLTMESDFSGWSSSSNDQPNVEKMLTKMKRMMNKNITEEQNQSLLDVLNGKSLTDDEGSSK